MTIGQPWPTSVDAPTVARLLDEAIDELGEDVPADERAIFAGMAAAARSGAAIPSEHVLVALKQLIWRAREADRSGLHVKLSPYAAALDPEDASIPYDMGNHLTRLGRTEQAIAAYTRALEIDPGFAWASYNRGRLLFDSGRFDEGLDDFVNSARAGCMLDGFHYNVARRYIKERGFSALAILAADSSLPPEQGWEFGKALAVCVSQAADWGGWMITEPDDADSDADPIDTFFARAELADILRESPYAHLIGFLHMGRSPSGYDAHITTDDEVRDALWYRPVRWRANEPVPDRVDHLERLATLLGSFESRAALWAAHYMSGAIVLSTLLAERTDWPTPVLRLSVPLEVAPDKTLGPSRSAVEAVDDWVLQHAPQLATVPRIQRLAGFAAAQFRAAAQLLLELLRNRAAPPPGEIYLVSEDDTPVMNDGEWATHRLAGDVAGQSWSCAEPVFREWVTAAGVIGGDSTEYVAGCVRAHQFNAVAATALWAELPPDEWQAARTRVAAAYDTEMSIAALREALGRSGLLIDFYVHEIVEDTVLQLALDADNAQVIERPVDTMAGELGLLLEAHRPGEMPAEGLSGAVDTLLLGQVRRRLGSTAALVLVPFGYLRNVPFHALKSVVEAIDAGQVAAVSYLPSTSFLDVVPDQEATPGRCLFVGFDPSGEIALDDELGILRDMFDDVEVLRDDRATPGAVVDALSAHDVVHFACHGDVDPRYRAGYLELAGGRLYPWHLLTGGPVPRTVLLNACVSGTTEIFEPTSDEAFGLHTAFLVAGATRVVGGLWDVNEWSAQHFTRAFYERWRSGASPAAAVVHAQQVLRAQTADPFLWAPHACFGDWR